MILDTNIVIGLFKNEPSLVHWFNQVRHSHPISISSVTRAEVLSEPKSTAAQRKRIATFLTLFRSISFDDEVADLVAQLRRTYPKLRVPDAAIAATALSKDIQLVTRDRGFQKVRELELIIP